MPPCHCLLLYKDVSIRENFAAVEYNIKVQKDMHGPQSYWHTPIVYHCLRAITDPASQLQILAS